MLRRTIGRLWKLLPRTARVRIVRATQTTFTVSVTAVVLNDRKEALLLNHVLRPRSGWGFPGGFLDAGEQPADAIKREIREETGIGLEGLRLHDGRVRGRHLEIIFTARTSDEPRVLSPEIYELGWFAPGSLPDGVTRTQAELIGAAVSAQFDNPFADK